MLYSWLPTVGCVSDLKRPHVAPNTWLNFDLVPSTYWLSPRVRTPVGPLAARRSEVAAWRQCAVVPAPPLKPASAGSQAMSPAAAITGSPLLGGRTGRGGAPAA